MTFELAIGIGVLSLLVALGIGYLIGARGTKKARVVELEGALETAQEELTEYKREVFGQFAETADKFRALDKSYHDLHRHLAASSVALCGDAATPLLESLEEPVPETIDEEIVVAEAGAQLADAETELSGNAAAEDGQPAAASVAAEPIATETNAAGTDEASATLNTLETEVVEDIDEVPTLTEINAEESRRDSARN